MVVMQLRSLFAALVLILIPAACEGEPDDLEDLPNDASPPHAGQPAPAGNGEGSHLPVGGAGAAGSVADGGVGPVGGGAAVDAAIEDPPWDPPVPAQRSAPDCGGVAPSCVSRSSGTCSEVRGCTLSGDCTGFSYSCYSQTNRYICIDIDGCYWSSGSETCAGASWACNTYTGSATCTAQLGCSWDTSCTGSADDCDTLGTASCETQPGCSLNCEAGSALCDLACVDLTDDEEHCGECGFACGPRSDCRDGICHCSAPYQSCAGRCVDTRNDAAHCGDCGRACASGLACVQGVCVDIDECSANPCSDGRSCQNTSGGFECSPCAAGYAEQDEVACVDIDECADDNGGCDPLTTCVNLPGSYSCGACPSGYAGTGVTHCVDIDECTDNDGGCDPLTTCENTAGSYHCSDCPDGYTGTGETGCADIDECAEGPICGTRATCENAPGAHVCRCKAYWATQGAECVDQHIQAVWTMGDVSITGVVATTSAVFVLHSDFAPKVEKRSTAGVVQWSIASSDVPYAAVSDGDSGIYVAYVHASALTVGSTTYPGTTGSGHRLMLLHLDGSGAQSVVGHWSCSFALDLLSLQRDAAGNLYLAGTFQGDFTLGTTTLDSLGNLDLFVFETNAAGQVSWTRHIGEVDRRTFPQLEVISSDEILLRYYKTTVSAAAIDTTESARLRLNGAGETVATEALPLDRRADAYTQPGGDTYLVGEDVQGYFWERIDGDGDQLARVSWPRDSMYSSVLGFTVDADGNPLVAGSFRSASLAIGDPPLLAPGGFQSYLAKFTPEGAYLWGVELSGGLFGITRDPAGAIYLYGKFREPLPYASSLGPGTMGAVIKLVP